MDVFFWIVSRPWAIGVIFCVSVPTVFASACQMDTWCLRLIFMYICACMLCSDGLSLMPC